MDRRRPEQLAIGPLGDRHELAQELDGRDRDDRGEQLELHAGEVDLAEPRRAGRHAFGRDGGDEILVAREHDDEHETGRQRQVDKPEHGQDDLGFGRRHQRFRDVIDMLAGLDEQGEQADHETQK